jgi:chitinase
LTSAPPGGSPAASSPQAAAPQGAATSAFTAPAASAAPSRRTALGASATGKWVSGYYVGYQQRAYPPSVIRWSGLTHLFVGRVVPNADGSLNTTFDVDPQGGPALARTLVTLAHQHDKKAVLMLGGAGTHDNWKHAASAPTRAVLVQNLVRLAADYGFDGFDIDWEPIEPVDQPDFLALARELRAALPEGVLAVPVVWVASTQRAPAFYGEIAPLFDQINIMSYGMAGPWGGFSSWHSSALHGETAAAPTSVDTSVRAYLQAGVPAAKLGIGVGFSGSCWSSPVTGPGMRVGSARIVADDNVMSFDHIMSAYFTPASRRWDAIAKVPYLSFASPQGPERCTFISYEDPESIAEKGKFVKARGLGGAIVWTINQGHRLRDAEGRRDPLMDALAEAFLQ